MIKHTNTQNEHIGFSSSACTHLIRFPLELCHLEVSKHLTPNCIVLVSIKVSSFPTDLPSVPAISFWTVRACCRSIDKGKSYECMWAIVCSDIRDYSAFVVLWTSFCWSTSLFIKRIGKICDSRRICEDPPVDMLWLRRRWRVHRELFVLVVVLDIVANTNLVLSGIGVEKDALKKNKGK